MRRLNDLLEQSRLQNDCVAQLENQLIKKQPEAIAWLSQVQDDAELKVKGFLLRTSQLEDELLKMSEDLKQAYCHLEKSREDARVSEVVKNQYKLEVTELSAHCKEYEVAIVDMRNTTKGIVRTMYRKYMQSNEHKSKILYYAFLWQQL